MEQHNICQYCNENICKNQNPYCETCVNSNVTDEMCEKMMMFQVDPDKTSVCICGTSAAKSCVLQSCKKCCNASNCQLHTKKNVKFTLGICSLCGEHENKLNIYYIKDKNLVSYCTKCYDKNKSTINLLIFINTKSKDRKIFKIPVNEKSQEKTQRIKILKINEEKQKEKKNAENVIQKELEKLKKNFNLVMDLLDDGILSNEHLKECVSLIDDELFDLLIEVEVDTVCKSCDNLCDLMDICYCKYCESYKCYDCISYRCTICEDEKCAYPTNLCKKTTFKCIECANKFVNEFNKTIGDKKITSQLLTLNNVDIVDFSDKDCDKIFNCGICKEDVNLTYKKISQCDTCNNFYCKKCGTFTMENIFVDPEDKIIFTCKTCSDNKEINNKNKKNKKVKDNNDVIIIKPRAFTKLETDTLAQNENEECAVCYTNKKMYACIPCGHLCLCYKCKSNIDNKCPLCNEKTENIVKIFT